MELMFEGFKLMVIGMGMVFIFLVIMILLVNINAKLIKPFAHLLETPEVIPRKSRDTFSQTGRSQTMGDEIPVVIAMAIHKYKSKN